MVYLRGLWQIDLAYSATYLQTYTSESSETSDSRDIGNRSDSSDSSYSSDIRDRNDQKLFYQKTFCHIFLLQQICYKLNLVMFFVTNIFLWQKFFCVGKNVRWKKLKFWRNLKTQIVPEMKLQLR